MGLVVAKHYRNLIDAQVAKAMLVSSGLHAVVLDEAQGGISIVAGWPNPAVQSFRLAVLEDDLIPAGELLSRLAEAPAADVEDDNADYDDSYRWDDLDAEENQPAPKESEPVAMITKVIAGVMLILLAVGLIVGWRMVTGSGS